MYLPWVLLITGLCFKHLHLVSSSKHAPEEHKKKRQSTNDHEESFCRPPRKDVNGFGQTKIMQRYEKYIKKGKIWVRSRCRRKIRKDKPKVTIVGAGASGLIAANLLDKLGFRVTILEASDRVGGRIQTYRDTRYGFKAELGPMRIPSHHILTLGVCRKYGLELAEFNDQQTKFTRGLHGHPQEIYHKLKDRVGGCGVFGPDCHVKVEQLFECFNKPKEDLACLSFNEVIRKYGSYTVGNWMNEKLPQFTGSEFLHFFVSEALAAWRDVSMINFLGSDLLHFENQTFYMVKDGFDLIARSMAADLTSRSTLKLNSRVYEIERFPQRGHEKVKVKFECFGTHCDDKETEVTSDYVIVTSPAPLTTSIKFSPPIRLAQWHGLRIMKYLTPVKVILVFKDQWWKEMHEKLNFKGGITTDMSFQQLWFPPEQPPNGLGVLLSSYAYGMTSQRYTGMSDDNVCREIIENLAIVFNTTEDFLRGRLVQHVIKRWGTDPHQLGGFAVQGAHEFDMYWSEIGRPNGHLLFAGEHLARPHGWINSALMSGIKSAIQVQENVCGRNADDMRQMEEFDLAKNYDFLKL